MTFLIRLRNGGDPWTDKINVAVETSSCPSMRYFVVSHKKEKSLWNSFSRWSWQQCLFLQSAQHSQPPDRHRPVSISPSHPSRPQPAIPPSTATSRRSPAARRAPAASSPTGRPFTGMELILSCPILSNSSPNNLPATEDSNTPLSAVWRLRFKLRPGWQAQPPEMWRLGSTKTKIKLLIYLQQDLLIK